MRPFRFLSYIRKSLIAKSVKIYPFSVVTQSIIQDYTYLSYGCKIHNATIGKYCSIAQNVKVGLGKHPLYYVSTSPIFYSANNPLRVSFTKDSPFDEYSPVNIGSDVWIGTNVTILDGVSIGDGAVIGANSLIVKDVEPYAIVGGVPGKLIRRRFDDQIISALIDLKWWDFPIEELERVGAVELFSKDVDLSIVLELSDKLKNS